MVKTFRKIAYFLIFTICLVNLLTVSTFGANTKIVSVKNLSVTLKLNGKYTLPNTVTATMSDKSTKSVTVTWDVNVLDTSKIGDYTIKGTVKGYIPKVLLEVKIIDPKITDTKSKDTKNTEISEIKVEINKDKWTLRSELTSTNPTKTSKAEYYGYSKITLIENNNNFKKAVTIGNNIICIHNDGKVIEYDSIKDTWNDKYQIAELKNSDGDFYLVSINNIIYIVGVNFSDILAYDPLTNKCSFETKLPTKRRVGGVVAANGKIYILGGFDLTIGSTIGKLDEYDPVTDKWANKADMIGRGANSVPVAYLDDHIYTLSYSYEKITLGVYDIKKDSWSDKTPTGNSLWYSRYLEATNGKLYVIVSDKKDYWNTLVQEYDPKTNICKWRTGSTTEREQFASVVLNGEIYLIGGIKYKPEPEPNPKDFKKLTFEEMIKYNEELRAKREANKEYIKAVEKYTPHKD